MSLIDRSYFYAQLTIANISQKAVQDSVDDFINLKEPEFLNKALGYDLSRSFILGLAEDPIPARWLELLQGVTFTNSFSRTNRWIGFAGANSTIYLNGNLRNNMFIYAGVTTGFPVAGNTFTDESLKNWNYSVDIRASGELDPDTEWEKLPGGGVHILIPGYSSQANEVWILRFSEKVINLTDISTEKISPTANYVWFEYMRNIVQQTVGVGVVEAKAENAAKVSPDTKMVEIWNMMSRQLLNLWQYLEVNRDAFVDDGYDVLTIDKCYFHPVNIFGI